MNKTIAEQLAGEAWKSLSTLGIPIHSIPPMRPCALCGHLGNVRITQEHVTQTWALSCEQDGWGTDDHHTLTEAIGQWNNHQAEVADRMNARAAQHEEETE